MVLVMSELYQVEAIIGRRNVNKGKREYRVKWKGYSQNESTWQPQENLIYVQQMIKNYEEARVADAQNSTIRPDSEQLAQNQQQIIEQLNFDQDLQSDDKNREQNEENYNQTVEYQESDNQKKKKRKEDENQIQEQIESQQSSNQSVFQIDEESDSDELKPYKKKRGRKNIKKTSKNRPNNYELQNVETNKVKTGNNSKNEKNQTTKQIKSDLQKVDQKMRYPPKNNDRNIEQRIDISNVKPNVIGINYRSNDSKQLMYLTEVQGLISYKPREYMIINWPDQLLKFYECRIDFSEIPRVSR